MNTKAVVALATVVLAVTCTGVAAAVSVDQWSGSGSVTGRGTETLVDSTPPFGTGLAYAVYTHRQIKFVLSGLEHPGNYTLAATGTMVNAKDEVTPGSAFFSFSGFDFQGKATLKGPSGAVVCKGGTLSWGGSAYNGNDYGQFQFPAACTVFSGAQYFSTAWLSGGGGVPIELSLFLVQQG